MFINSFIYLFVKCRVCVNFYIECWGIKDEKGIIELFKGFVSSIEK